MQRRHGQACTARSCAPSPPTGLTAQSAPVRGPPRLLRSHPRPQHALYSAYAPARRDSPAGLVEPSCRAGGAGPDAALARVEARLLGPAALARVGQAGLALDRENAVPLLDLLHSRTWRPRRRGPRGQHRGIGPVQPC